MAQNSTSAASADSVSASVSPEAENTFPSKTKLIQHRYIPARQILFLKAVRAHEPWSKPHDSVTSSWESLANDYCKEVNNPNAINAEGARRHWERLLKLYNGGEKDSLRISGTEKEYDEVEELLASLAITTNNFKHIDTLKDDDVKKRKKMRQDEFSDQPNKAQRISALSPSSTPPLLPMPLSPVDDNRNEEMLSPNEREGRHKERGYGLETEHGHGHGHSIDRISELPNKHRHCYSNSEEFMELKRKFKHDNALLRDLLQTRKNDLALLQKMLDLEERRLAEQTAERLQRERFYECQLRLAGEQGRKLLDGRPGVDSNESMNGKSDEFSRTA